MTHRHRLAPPLALALFALTVWASGPGAGTTPSRPGPVPGPAPVPRVPTPHVANPLPPHSDYPGICTLLREWAAGSDGLAEVGEYGRSARGAPLTYLRLGNRTGSGTPVLVHAAIHGNEPLSGSVVLAYAGHLLSGYSREPRCRALLDSLDLYVIPAVSPDTWARSREVEGVDPNRNFDSPGPCAPVAGLKVLAARIHPRACWSGHTSGRVFLIPPGNTTAPTADDAAYQSLFGEMAKLSGYRLIHGCEMYGHPIRGTEIDWYHAQGAAANVCEYGTIQRPATPEEIRVEFSRTWPAFLLWLEKAPALRRPT